MPSIPKTAAAYMLRSVTVAIVLTAVTLGAVFASQPSFAEEKDKKPVVTQQVRTGDIVGDKMKSANRNAEAVRALL
jgi:hypothetical protein